MENRKFLGIVLYILILGITWPLISSWITLFGRRWLMYPICVIICALYRGFHFNNKALLGISFFSVVAVIKTYHEGGNILGLSVDFCMFVFLLMLCGVVDYKNNNKVQSIFLITFLILLVYTTISSFVINNIYPNIVRENQLYINVGMTGPFHFLQKYGLTNYIIPHAVPILIPSFILGAKITNGLHKVLYYFLAVICIVLTYVSGAATPFLLAICITIFAFIIKKGKVAISLRYLIILGLFVLLVTNENIIVSFLSGIDNTLGNEGVIHERVVMVQNSILSDQSEGDLAIRQEKYTNSWYAFSSNIILGGNSQSVGGHAFLLDILGKYGLFGFIPFAIFLFTQIKYVYNQILDDYKIFYVLSIFAAVGMLVIKNMSGWTNYFFLFIVAPLLINSFGKGQSYETN